MADDWTDAPASEFNLLGERVSEDVNPDSRWDIRSMPKPKQPRMGFMAKLGNVFMNETVTGQAIQQSRVQDAGNYESLNEPEDVPHELYKDIFRSEFQAGLVPEIGQDVMLRLEETYDKYGEAAAAVEAQNIANSMATRDMLDNETWWAQMGYSAAAMMLDPTSYGIGASANVVVKGAGSIAKGVIKKSIRELPKRKLHQSVVGNAGATMAEYAATGAVESAVANSARLYGDVTYTTEDFKMDLLADTLLGGALGGIVGGWRGKTGALQYDASVREAERNVDKLDMELAGDKSGFRLADAVPSYGVETGIRFDIPTGMAPAAPKSTIRKQINDAYRGSLLVDDVFLNTQKGAPRMGMDKLVEWANTSGRSPVLKEGKRDLSDPTTLIVGLSQRLLKKAADAPAQAAETKWLDAAAFDATSQLNLPFVEAIELVNDAQTARRVSDERPLELWQLDGNLAREWQDVQHNIRQVMTNDIMDSPLPEHRADMVQALHVIRQRASKVRDALVDLNHRLDTGWSPEYVPPRKSEWEQSAPDMRGLEDAEAYANAEDVIPASGDFHIPLSSLEQLAKGMPSELSNLSDSLRSVHSERTVGVLEGIKNVLNPQRNQATSRWISLADVSGLSGTHITNAIRTLKNSALAKDAGFKKAGILPRLHAMNRTLKVAKNRLEADKAKGITGEPLAQRVAEEKALRKAIGRLALDYVVLASHYSKGIPMTVATKLANHVHFPQKKAFVNDVLGEALEGTPRGRAALLKEYNAYLMGDLQATELGGTAKPIVWDDFKGKHADMFRFGRNDVEQSGFAMEVDGYDGTESDLYDNALEDGWISEEKVDVDAIGGQTQNQLQQLEQLNRDALNSGNPSFIAEVEQLNAHASRRLEEWQANELEAIRVETAKSIQLSPTEIVAQMKAEGYVPRTPEWKEEFGKRRNKRVKLSDDVQAALGQQTIDNMTKHKVPEVEVLPLNMARRQPADKKAYSTWGSEQFDKEWQTMRNEIVGPLELYPTATPARKEIQKIVKKRKQFNANMEKAVEKMVKDGDVPMLTEVLEAAAEKRIRNQQLADRKRVRLEKLKKRKAAKAQAAAQKAEDAKAALPLSQKPEYKDAMRRLQKTKDTYNRIAKEWDGTPKSPADLFHMEERLREAHTAMHDIIDEIHDMDGKPRSESAEASLDASIARTETEIELLEESTASTGQGGLNDGNIKSLEGTQDVPESVAREGAKLVARDTNNRVTEALSKFEEGELRAFEEATKPRTTGAWFGYHVGRSLGLTQDLATTFQKSDSIVMKYMGAKITEMGRGFGGNAKRNHTGAVIKEAEYTASVMQVIPSYTRAVDAFALGKGKGAVGRLAAKTMSGEDNPLVKEFNQAFMRIMNDKRLGREVSTMPDGMDEFIKDWEAYMEYNHGRLTDEGITGFTQKKKVPNYVPQIWQRARLQKAMQENHAQVLELFEKGYRSAGHFNANELAKRQLDYLANMSEGVDQFMPNTEARSRHQIRIDQSVEVDGLRLLDLLDTDLATMSMKYSNRMSGYVGLAKSTNGAIKGNIDIMAMRNMLVDEVGESNKSVRDFDDVIDLMFGRPTRGGLQPWMRSFKDLAALTKMGGLGTAQAIESGTIATRALLEASADPKFLKKLTEGLSPEDTATDLKEMMKLTGYNWDYEWLNRQSSHLDQNEVGQSAKLKAVANEAAEFATFGKLKAPASRGLSKISGYNAVRKYQSAVMQRSFGFAVARHFKYGSSKMTPARMADLGLTDVNGINGDMKRMIDEYVEFDADGYPSKYNFDKWDVGVREQFHYAMQRAEAQDIQRGLVGELPRYMNHPLMQIVAQFRNMPLIANNKALARSLAFGDKEAATQLALNTMAAGAIRAAKVSVLAGGYMAIKGTEWGDEFDTKWDAVGNDSLMPGGMDKYITQAGIWADVNSVATIAGQTWVDDDKTAVDMLLGQIPALGTMESGFNTGLAAGQGDAKEAVNQVQGYTPLGNTAMMEWLFTWLDAQMNKD